jgi:anthranilate phosphoribosyltransferase
VAGRTTTVQEGIAQSAAAIDSGAALGVLNTLVAVSNRPGGQA